MAWTMADFRIRAGQWQCRACKASAPTISDITHTLDCSAMRRELHASEEKR